MRTVASTSSNFIFSSYSSWTLVEVFNTSNPNFTLNSWVSLNDCFGNNFIKSAVVEESNDQNMATAKVALKRNIAYWNLSPLMTLSAVTGLVDIYKKIRISFAVMPADVEPSSSDYILKFRGRIAQIDWAADTLQVDCRDDGGDLMDLCLESLVEYSSDISTQLVETVMQSILNNAAAAAGYTPVTLYSVTGTGGTPFQGADSPGWALRLFTQQLMPTLGALDVLAKQIAWLVKYKYNSSVADYVLTFWDPSRASVTPVYTFTPSQYRAPSTLERHIGDIRNVVCVRYTDPSGNAQSVTVSDAASIALYGRRFFQIAEEASSQVNTSTEALKMANGALSDLAQPNATMQIDVPLFWPGELNDTYTFAANGTHFDTNQNFSVVGLKHSVTEKTGITSMTVRGKPSGGWQMWYDRMATGVSRKFGAGNVLGNFNSGAYPNGGFSQNTKF